MMTFFIIINEFLLFTVAGSGESNQYAYASVPYATQTQYTYSTDPAAWSAMRYPGKLNV